jgi:F-type H+-transporting ATPase subunit alpha
LKLDQAQYRELEAFSKFGSDLDAATKAVLDKGARNVEILKQAENTPFTVEKQIAILFIGTKNMANKVPVNKIKEFEKNFLTQLETRFPDTYKALSKPLTDEIEKTLADLAAEVSLNYY